MSRFFSPAHASLTAYTPGEQPQDKKYIKLNTNESPYPPSNKVLEAVNSDEVKDLRLYCDPDCKKLKSALAELLNVEINMEVNEMASATILEQKKQIVADLAEKMKNATHIAWATGGRLVPQDEREKYCNTYL